MIEYYKMTVRLINGNPVVIEYRGPYRIDAECGSLRDVLEKVFEYDNLYQSDGPSLTGYPVGQMMDFVIVNWRGRSVVAYCAPIGWVVLNDVSEAEEINRSAKLPTGLTVEDIRSVFNKVQQLLRSGAVSTRIPQL